MAKMIVSSKLTMVTLLCSWKRHLHELFSLDCKLETKVLLTINSSNSGAPRIQNIHCTNAKVFSSAENKNIWRVRTYIVRMGQNSDCFFKNKNRFMGEEPALRLDALVCVIILVASIPG